MEFRYYVDISTDVDCYICDNYEEVRRDKNEYD